MKWLDEFRAALVEDRRIWPLLAMVCCTMIGSAMVAPVLSLYAASFGVSATLVGMLVTIFGVGRIVANFPAGWLSQRLGRRPLLAAGPAIIAIGAVGAALTNDFHQLLFWRCVQGVGSGMYQTVSLAALADISTPRTRGRMVGLYYAALQFGASIGPIIGGYVGVRWGLAAPFWALLVIALTTLMLALTTFHDAPATFTRSASGALGARRGLINAPFLAISLVSALMFFTRTACMFQLIPFIGHEKFGLGVDAIGVAITVIAVFVLAMLPLAGMMTDRLGARLATIVSMAVTAIGVALVLVGDHPFWFWSSMVVYGAAGGLNSPAVGAFTIEALPRHKYGEGMGLQRTISDIGYVAGPVVAGFVTDVSGYGLQGAFIAVVAMIVLVTIVFTLASAGMSAQQRPPSG